MKKKTKLGVMRLWRGRVAGRRVIITVTALCVLTSSFMYYVNNHARSTAASSHATSVYDEVQTEYHLTETMLLFVVAIWP